MNGPAGSIDYRHDDSGDGPVLTRIVVRDGETERERTEYVWAALAAVAVADAHCWFNQNKAGGVWTAADRSRIRYDSLLLS